MPCPVCGSENAPEARFCGNCGGPQPRRCPACDAVSPATAKFCSACGASLAAAAEPPTASGGRAESIASAEPQDAGERRHLTVLFSDLFNSTAISAALDPEDWSLMAAEYQRAARDAITGFGGHVAKYLGDGVMAYFGWPEAHENDAERAVRAALALQAAMEVLNGRSREQGRPELLTRIGIHTGPVVVGQGGGGSADVFGETPNVAARVQAAAPPGSIFMTAAVHQLVSGLFVVEERGTQPLKGVREPAALFRVVEAKPVRERIGMPGARALTPLVGREEELQLLRNRWERTREGEGQVVLITGEPGIGKSRLVREFAVRVAGTEHVWLECAGEPFQENTPFYAVSQMLQQGIGWTGSETPAERVVLLERAFERAGMKVAEAVPLVCEILGLPVPEGYVPVLLTAEQKRRRLLATLAGWIFNTVRERPLVVVLEDLVWADPSTLELLAILAEQGVTVPLMLVFTARPEFRAPWPMRSHHAQISLNQLNERHVREMITRVAALPPAMIDAVARRTTGVPLFVEELTRLVAERGQEATREVPATLHDSLMARLDSLGAAREIAQVAAVVGREFSYELLAAVSEVPDADLQAGLKSLADAELVYARGMPPEATYIFKHALVRDVAYETLLKSRRRELHRRVAGIVTERLPELANSRPEMLARHLTAAGDAEPALAAWRRAGDRDYARRAFKEAEESYRQALAIIFTLPESLERDAREIELQLRLAQALAITTGYNAPATTAALARARALAESGGSLTQLTGVLLALHGNLMVSGDLMATQAIDDQLLELVRHEERSSTVAGIHVGRACVLYYRGELIEAEEQFARAAESLATPGFERFPGAGAVVFGFAASNAWMLGRPDTARQRIAKALEDARQIGSPYDLAFALRSATGLQYLLRDFEEANRLASQVAALSKEHGFPYFASMSKVDLGWAGAHLGRAHEGVAMIREGLSEMAATGNRLGLTLLFLYLADALALDGAIDQALDAIEDSLQANSQELVFRPASLCFRAELHLRLGQTERAADDMRDALALARRIGARSWQLRAATGLARMMVSSGDMTGTRDALAPIYAGFTEGFDTRDLVDAKALLDAISR
jgi:class 3 adenylate cyclase/tetratricopeptide (TPR) repeat protein